ncbi:MAG: phosphatase PAP2 family protein [Tepidiformaceae bacterium]
MNESVFDAINGLAGRSSFLDSIGRFGANDLLYVVCGILFILGVHELLADRRMAVRIALAAVLAVGASLVIGSIIAHFWFEARPFVTHPDTIRLIPHSADNAFPSDHALVAGAAATVGLIAWPRWGWLAVLGAVLLSLARVFVGVHYPGDVLAGLAIGAACAVLAWWIVGDLSRRTGFLAPNPIPATVKGPAG